MKRDNRLNFTAMVGIHHFLHSEHHSSSLVVCARYHRRYTCVIYLNTLNEKDGGETEFPGLQPRLKIKPHVGWAVLFRNNKPHPNTSTAERLSDHIAHPILTSGVVKYALN